MVRSPRERSSLEICAWASVGSGDTESHGRLRWPSELDGKSLQQGHIEGVDGNGQEFSAGEGKLAAPGWAETQGPVNKMPLDLRG